MAIRISLAQLGFPYHMTYAGLGLDPYLHISTLTRILLYRNRSNATREPVSHLLESFKPDAFTSMGTQYSRYLSTPSAWLSFPIKD
jgi:hypothetical protein